MCVVRGETLPPHHDGVGDGVEHVLTMLANTMEESAGEPQKEGALRCVERTGALGQMGGQTARTLDMGCCLSHSYWELPFPLQPEAFPALRRGRWCWQRAEGRGLSPSLRGHGPGTDAGDGGAIWHNLSCSFSAWLGLSPACEESEGQSPSMCPSNKGVMRMVKDTVARDHEFH